MRNITPHRNKPIQAMIAILINVSLTVLTPGAAITQGLVITKDKLIAALKDCKQRRDCKECERCVLTADDFIQRIKILKVDFKLSLPVEQEIRQAGAFLDKTGLNNLIEAVRSSYRDISGENEICQNVKQIEILIIAKEGTDEFKKLEQVGEAIVTLLEGKHCNVTGPFPHSKPTSAARDVKYVSAIKYFDLSDKASADRIADHLRSEGEKIGININLDSQDHLNTSNAKSLKNTLDIYLLKNLLNN